MSNQLRVSKGDRPPPGLVGLEALRAFLDKRSTNFTTLLGAFRGQSVYPQHRLKGMGTWRGLLDIQAGSPRLSFEQFFAALLELGIVVPEDEAKATFDMIAVNGTMAVPDLVRQIHVPPCDRSGRWGQEYSLPRDEIFSMTRATLRSGYHQEGLHTNGKLPFEATHEKPDVGVEWQGRVEPTRSSGYLNSMHSGFGMLMQDPEEKSNAGLPIDDGSLTAQAFMNQSYKKIATHPLTHLADDDPDRWVRDRGRLTQPIDVPYGSAPVEKSGALSLEARACSTLYLVCKMQVFGSFCRFPPYRCCLVCSGYTRDSSLDLSHDWSDRPPPQQPAWRMASTSDPWTSGYNRGSHQGFLSDEWTGEEHSRPTSAVPPEFDPTMQVPSFPPFCCESRQPVSPASPPLAYQVQPSRESGYSRMCSICEHGRLRRHLPCPFCHNYHAYHGP